MTIRQADSFLRGSAFWFTFGRLSPFYHLCFIGFLPMPSHQIRPAKPRVPVSLPLTPSYASPGGNLTASIGASAPHVQFFFHIYIFPFWQL